MRHVAPALEHLARWAVLVLAALTAVIAATTVVASPGAMAAPASGGTEVVTGGQ